MKFPFFVLLGDPFLCETKRKVILSALEKDFSPPIPFTLARAGEIPVTQFLQEARTLPFMAKAQVFCIRDSDRFTKGDLALWASYFTAPHPQSFFIFEAESLEKDHLFFEKAAQARQLFHLKVQGDQIVSQFIHEKITKSGKKISKEAEELIESRIAGSLLFLDSFLNQLILYAGEKPAIELADIEALEEKLSKLEGDDLLQALAERRTARALEALNDLLESNFRDFPSVAGLLHWQLRRFWEAKKWQSEGMNERDIATRLRLSPARTGNFFRGLKRFSIQELERILEGLFELDWRLKTGRAEGRFEIESWTVNATG